jgi:hypothetical protein
VPHSRPQHSRSAARGSSSGCRARPEQPHRESVAVPSIVATTERDRTNRQSGFGRTATRARIGRAKPRRIPTDGRSTAPLRMARLIDRRCFRLCGTGEASPASSPPTVRMCHSLVQQAPCSTAPSERPTTARGAWGSEHQPETSHGTVGGGCLSVGMRVAGLEGDVPPGSSRARLAPWSRPTP